MNQSGIRVSDALAQAVADLPLNVRTLKISILNDKLEAADQQQVVGSFRQDFDKITKLVGDNEAAYILVRQDSDQTKFVFVSFVPDTARVRDKMTYASTRNTLSRELGSSKFANTYFATTKDELTFDAYDKHQAQRNEPPLSEKEKDIRDIKEAETNTSNTSSRRAIVPNGIAFPVSDDAQQALNVLKTTSVSRLVILTIDLKKETIELFKDKEVDIDQLEAEVSAEKPQYVFFSYVHDNQGVGTTTQCFVYICPSSSKVKERMLYSSNRQSITNAAQFPIDIKYESEDLDITDLKQRIHPPQTTISSSFSRPKRPGKK